MADETSTKGRIICKTIDWLARLFVNSQNLIVIATIISTVYIAKTYQSTSDSNRLLNRPYIEIIAPTLSFYDKDSKELLSPLKMQDAKYFTITIKFNNYGNIPAKMIFNALDSPFASTTSTNSQIIFKDHFYLTTNTLPVDTLKKILKETNNSLIFKDRITYSIPGDTSHVYYTYIESGCDVKPYTDGSGADIICHLLKSEIF